MSMNFYIRNAGWAVLNPSEAYQAKKAMNEYRKQHPVCEITGSDKKVQVHHIVPVWADPTLANDPNNFISLSICSNVHLLLGHAGNYSNKYVGNIKELAANIQEILSHKTVVHRAPNIKLIKISIFRKIYNKIVDFLK